MFQVCIAYFNRKETMRSLISAVTHCHKQNLCLGSLSIKNLMISSLGTFQMKKVQTTPLTEQGRVADLAAVSNLLTKILKWRHGPGATRSIPPDFIGLQNKLMNPKTPAYLIDNDPSLLPATSYVVAFLRGHGHMTGCM